MPTRPEPRTAETSAGWARSTPSLALLLVPLPLSPSSHVEPLLHPLPTPIPNSFYSMTRNLSLSPTATPHLGQLSPLTSSPYHHHQLSPRGVSAGGAELKRVYTESSQGMDGVFALFVLCWLERCALVSFR